MSSSRSSQPGSQASFNGWLDPPSFVFLGLSRQIIAVSIVARNGHLTNSIYNVIRYRLKIFKLCDINSPRVARYGSLANEHMYKILVAGSTN